MLETVEWGKYKLKDVFEKAKCKNLKYKTSDLPSKPTKGFDLPALTAGVLNQGLNNYVPRTGATILKNVISISANGANTGATFYQKHEFTVLQDAYAIEYKLSDDILTDKEYLFLASAVSNAVFGNYNWSNKAGWERIKDTEISLPVKDGKPDFAFMKRFISHLEAHRIRELEAYLEVAGLKNTTLTEKEKKVLDMFENSSRNFIYRQKEASSLKWKAFKVRELYEINPTKAYRMTNSELLVKAGKTPLITNISNNNGVLAYLNLDPTEAKGIITFSDTGTKSEESFFYQPIDFIGYSHVQGMYPIFDKEEHTIEIGQYIYTYIKKVIKGKYDYGNKMTRHAISDEIIYLPMLSNNTPDFSYLRTFIKAIQKITIKNVVAYADKKIEAAKEVVNQ